MIEVEGVSKAFGSTKALAGVDMSVPSGTIQGLLGPNGAGKTTALRMLLGLIRPTEGTASLFGRDPLLHGARSLDGVAGFVEAPRFYPYLTGRKNLELVAALDGGDATSRIERSLDVVEMSGRARDKVGGYSHGMRQRLGIAAALLRNPRLMLLDEPATGLDPGGMRDMRLLIRRLSQEGMTVLLSSHLLTEVEELCNRVAIIRSGVVVYEGALEDLRAGPATYHLRTTDNDLALRVCRAQAGLSTVVGEASAVRFHAAQAAVAELSVALVEAGAAITALTPQTATLEDLFFQLTEGDGEAPATVTAQVEQPA